MRRSRRLSKKLRLWQCYLKTLQWIWISWEAMAMHRCMWLALWAMSPLCIIWLSKSKSIPMLRERMTVCLLRLPVGMDTLVLLICFWKINAPTLIASIQLEAVVYTWQLERITFRFVNSSYFEELTWPFSTARVKGLKRLRPMNSWGIELFGTKIMLPPQSMMTRSQTSL